MAQDNAALRSVQWHDIGEDGDYPGQSVAKREAQGPSNPFTMPNDEEIFLLRDQERERKKAEREVRMNQKIWEKGTWTTRISVPRRELLEDGEGGDVKVSRKKTAAAGAPDSAGGARRREKENMVCLSYELASGRRSLTSPLGAG